MDRSQKPLFGLTVGLAIAFLLEGVQMAAQILGLQAGYSYASTVDPTTQADTTTLQLMAQLLAGMLFFAFGFDRQVLHVLARSLESGPGLRSRSMGHAIEAIVGLGAAIFSAGLQLAMPVLALLVLLDIAFAVLGRLHAQLQTSLAILCDQDADRPRLSRRRAIASIRASSSVLAQSPLGYWIEF